MNYFVEKSMRKNFPLEQKKEVDYLIAQIIILDQRPFSIVEDEGFRAFTLRSYPGYEIPGRKYFSKKVIPELFELKAAKVKSIIMPLQKGGCGLTTDSWKSLAGDHYLRY